MSIELSPDEDVLLVKYLQDRCNPEEKKRVKEWISKSDAHRDYFDELQYTWDKAGIAIKAFEGIDVQSGWEQVQNRIQSKKHKKNEKVLKIFAWSVAASVLFFVLIRLGFKRFRESNIGCRSKYADIFT